MTLQTNLLKGELVYLTARKKEENAQFVEWWRNSDYARLIISDLYKPVTVEQLDGWYDNIGKNNNFVPFAMRTLESNILIGFVNLVRINWQARHCEVVLGIGNTDYWGKGYGSDAMRIALRYAFMEMNMNRVGLDVNGYNQRAIKSYEKVGFVHEGKLRQHIHRDGQRHDSHLMSILREEWENDTTD